MPTFYDLSVKSPSRALTFVPGVGLTLLITFVGFAVHDRFDAVSPLVASLAIGVASDALAAAGSLRSWTWPLLGADVLALLAIPFTWAALRAPRHAPAASVSSGA